MTEFLKDSDLLESLNFSEISDVDPEEIGKIVKSANEIDDKIFGFPASKTSIKESSRPQPSPRGAGADSAEKSSRKISSAGGTLNASTYEVNIEKKEEKQKPVRKRTDSSDWLGLLDTTGNEIETRGSTEKDMHMSGSLMKPRTPSKKGRLLDELFPGSNLLSQVSDVDINKKVEDKGAEESNSFIPPSFGASRPATSEASYFPSVTPVPQTPSARSNNPRATDNFDWLLSPATKLDTTPTSNQDGTVRKGATPSAPSARASASGSKTKDNTLPDWLAAVVTPQETNEEFKTHSDTADTKKSDVAKQDEAAAENYTQPKLEITDAPSTKSEGDWDNIVSTLESIQKTLGDAIVKKNESILNSIKVLIKEAKQVSGSNFLSKPAIHTEENSEKFVNQYDEMIKEKEDIIRNLEMEVKSLEFKKSQLEMEIENIKIIHQMEKETINKNHELELSASESRLERTKETLEEIVEELKSKINKLKENEDTLREEYKAKIGRVEEERREEVERLKKCHKEALEEAAALTTLHLHTPGRSKVLKIPMLSTEGLPAGEEQLAHREATLIEKEKQLQVMKAALEEEKEELEEKIEVEKAKLLEDERELRRKQRENRRKDEERQAAAKREKESLNSFQAQLKSLEEELMRGLKDLTRKRLELAAEKARLEASHSLHGHTPGTNLGHTSPIDLVQKQVEAEAAMETYRDASNAAEAERRKHAEMRQALEQTSWEQKEAEQRLQNREAHIHSMLENAEKIRKEGFTALEEAKKIKNENEAERNKLDELAKSLEAQEKVFSKERLEIAREKLEIERKRSQLDIFLPDLTTVNDLAQQSKVFIDPKAVLLRLKAEKEFETAIAPRKP